MLTTDMHPLAVQWDAEHMSPHMGGLSWRWVPQDRPCDWCGQPVKEGFIHLRCFNRELETMRYYHDHS